MRQRSHSELKELPKKLFYALYTYKKLKMEKYFCTLFLVYTYMEF